jgi:hypothetical protein
LGELVGDPILAQSQGRCVLMSKDPLAQRISPLDEAIRKDPTIKKLGEDSRRAKKAMCLDMMDKALYAR